MIFVLYVIAVLIGISLGLIGAGGAIVAVPSFVYLGGIPASLASGYALFVVAIASAVGSIQYIRNNQINWRAVFAFGTSTLVTIAVTRSFLLPAIPIEIPIPGVGIIPKNTALMFAFSGVLFYAAISMMRKRAPSGPTDQPTHFLLLTAYGVIIGFVSGFLGVGGGFLMTPALVVWARLDMKTAVGTSLVLIASNSIVGVGADMLTGIQYNWSFVSAFTILTTAGILLGTQLSTRIHGSHLKKGFGWFVLAIAIAVLIRETISVNGEAG